MDNRLKLSIITPSFNQGAFLRKTIESIIDQSNEIEYFVIDGNSIDASRSIIQSLQDRITWWVSEKDNGQSEAINKGLKRATGEIINWINSDDYYEPGAFEVINDAFQDPKINMVSFRANVFGLENRISRGTDIFPDSFAKTLAYSRIDQPETFFRKSAVDKMGLLNEDLHYCMDKEWLLRYLFIFGQNQCENRHEIILNFRYHESSKSVSHQNKFAEEADNIYLAYAKLLGDEKYIRLISELINEKKEISIPFERFDQNLLDDNLDNMLNYYLFKRFIEKYEELDFSTAKKLGNSIDRSKLLHEDKKQLELLYGRLKYPKWAISLARKISR